MKRMSGECEACGRLCPREYESDRLCRKCRAAQSTIDRLEEAAWKNQAWSVFTRIETAATEV